MVVICVEPPLVSDRKIFYSNIVIKLKACRQVVTWRLLRYNSGMLSAQIHSFNTWKINLISRLDYTNEFSLEPKSLGRKKQPDLDCQEHSATTLNCKAIDFKLLHSVISGFSAIYYTTPVTRK